MTNGLSPRFRLHWQMVLTLLMFAFMYLPVLVLAFFSFNASPFSSNWQGFSLKWYQKMFSDTRILSALQDSLSVAFFAVAVSAVLGTLMAVGLARYMFPGKGLYQGMAYLPLIIPDIAIAVATLVFLASMAIPLSLWTVVAAHVVFCIAYIAVVVSTRLAGLNPFLQEAALDLGATPVQAFIKVLLPEIMPAIISGCLLSFVLSMDDLLISSFTAGGGVTTLPMEIFSRVRTGVKPDINALSVVLILGSGLLAFAAEFIRFQGDRRRLNG
ncbi:MULTISPECIES: ABC transporter permease [unclassified Leptolyngbya]|uniref:ABC transporter permease n=1 Tax=unclassified Leptolyngbya TaxID=2650499 RepID=UPI001687B043|nr:MULTISPECIES: ABC transporter permease [unclassified Leptolyngbya]MBD1912974.1 ABC transporter permease [Leptolyngbya sp. FACHB-8]MBD2155715.1 ABC transporter permease [Leptolyngbya sp. FACHB-16]